MTADVERLYEEEVKPLPARSRLELLARIAHDLALSEGNGGLRQRSLLELEGLGAALWVGVDGQAYVDRLRSEWEPED